MGQIKITRIEVERLVPNDWNPNHLTAPKLKKLQRSLLTDGQLMPVVVRKHPSKRNKFQIIDGEQRYTIAIELKWNEIECVIIDVPDDRAKILTANLNYLKGNARPKEYAQLVHSLNESISLDQLSIELPETKLQLQDSLNLLKLPDDLDKTLEDKAAAEAKEKLNSITIQVTDEEKAIIDAAIKSSDKKKRGAAIATFIKAGMDVLKDKKPASKSPA